MQCTPPPNNEQELLERAHHIAGKTLTELAMAYNQTLPKSLGQAKGYIGQLIEWHLGAPQDNCPRPDFAHLGIELKTIPINKKGQPKESTYVCTVGESRELCQETWHRSRVYQKLQRILWIPIEADPSITLAERKVGQPLLWSPTQTIEEVLKKDWEELTEMILFGQHDKITAHIGSYLQIRPKAAHSRILQQSFNEEGEISLNNPKGFYLRSLLTKKIFSEYFLE